MKGTACANVRSDRHQNGRQLGEDERYDAVDYYAQCRRNAGQQREEGGHEEEGEEEKQPTKHTNDTKRCYMIQMVKDLAG